MNAFRQASGKLVMWHGWADGLLPPQLTVDFYEALAKKSGGMAAAQDFARLFMVPSMEPCEEEGGRTAYRLRSASNPGSRGHP
jgi:hypothetical protein